jgi:KDO2-lipid IV(A) lauroyltransferase
MGTWSAFFNRPAYTMTLSARLALQTQATVLVAWGERLSWGRGYCVHVQAAPLALPNDTALAVDLINQTMAALILTCPQQYLWGYQRYKTPRSDA